MRVSAETKQATRDRILRSAQRLFADQGYDATTTRDIARTANIAAGTLFNYFPTKDAIVASWARQALDDATEAFDLEASDVSGLEEDLFSFVALGLRKLKLMRKHLPALLETSLSPLVTHDAGDGPSLRVAQLEVVAKLAAKHGHGEISTVALQMYWSLYAGLLTFWSQDESRKQEDTLALLDQSLNMFVGWLRNNGAARSATNQP